MPRVIRRHIRLFLMGALFSMTAAAQEGLVWTVQSTAGPSFLVGLTHISSESDYRSGLPAPVLKALASSKAVYFETNLLPMSESGQVDTRQWIAEITARYPKADLTPLYLEPVDLRTANERLLRQISTGDIANPNIPPRVVKRLNEEVDHLFPLVAGQPSRDSLFVRNALAAASDAWLLWEVPTMLSAAARGRMALVNPEQKLRPGLDSLLMAAAIKSRKSIALLESYPRTMRIFSSLLNEDDRLEENLMSMIDESLRPNPDELLYSTTHPIYTGNVSELLNAVENQKAKSEMFKKIFYPSSVIRNLDWVSSIQSLIDSNKCPCIFAVGGVHLVGEQGLPNLLRAKGLTTSRTGNE